MYMYTRRLGAILLLTNYAKTVLWSGEQRERVRERSARFSGSLYRYTQRGQRGGYIMRLACPSGKTLEQTYQYGGGHITDRSR